MEGKRDDGMRPQANGEA